MGWSISGGILYPPAVTPPPGAVPVSAPPSAAPTSASATSGSDGDYKKWLNSIGLFSGLANTGGQSANELVAGIVDPSPAAPQAAFTGLTPTAAAPAPDAQTVLPAAAPGDMYFNNWYNHFVTDALAPQNNPAWNPEIGYNPENPQPGTSPDQYLPSKYTDLMDMNLQRAALQDYGRLTSGNNSYALPDNVDVMGSLRNAYKQGNFHVQDQGGDWLFDNPVSRLIDGVGSSPEMEQLFQAVVMYYLGGGASNAMGGSVAGTSSATAAGAAEGASNAAVLGSTPSAAVAGSEYGAAAAGAGGSGGVAGMLSTLPTWATRAGTMYGSNYLTNGGDAKGAAKNTALGMGIGYGADAAAPYVNDALDAGNSFSDSMRRKGMLGTQVADASSVLGPMSDAAAADPANYNWLADTTKDNTFATRMASDPFTPMDLTAPLPASSAPAPAAANPDAPPAQKSAVTSQDLQRYTKIGMQVNDLIGAAKGAPQQPPADATPEDQQKYYSDVVNYLGLDAQTMAAAGLQPGSPEYTQYILDQADAIISQTMQGLDVNSADLSAQLRTKTDQELQQLQRALYVRGQLGQQMGAGTYVDPATGTPQEVLGGGMFDPNVGAYQRGLAGNVNDLAGKQGQGAYDYLQGMLGRHADMFGMQGAADAQFEQAKRNDQNPDELRRRRGMLGSGI